MQFEEKPVVHLPRQRRTFGTAFIGCRVRQGVHAIWRKTTMHFGSLVWTPNPTSEKHAW